MKIAIISDIHENYHNLTLFFTDIEGKNIEQIICLWDLIGIWISKLLAFNWIPVFMVWWNNDWSKVQITKISFQEWSKLKVSDEIFDFLEFEDKKFFLTHYPKLAVSMAKSWDFDAVFYWHNHEQNIEKIWNCLIINPWEISAFKTWKATYAIYDTENNIAEIIDRKNVV